MPVCSYLVIPGTGGADVLASRLGSFPECDVARAENSDLLLLVTDTPSVEEDERLRARIEALPELHALVLTFGEVAAGEVSTHPGRKSRQRRPGLPVVNGFVPGRASSSSRDAEPR